MSAREVWVVEEYFNGWYAYRVFFTKEAAQKKTDASSAHGRFRTVRYVPAAPAKKGKATK